MSAPVRFLGGVRKSGDVPRLKVGPLPRAVFAGRSNVGKSSLLNILTGSKMARVSASPGKTQEMNFFSWKTKGREILLVDLPGYGFARVSKDLRAEWGREIAEWLSTDPLIAVVACLVDGRHGFFEQDVELVEFLRGASIPFVVVFTKMDKWKSNNQRREAEKKLKLAAENFGAADFIFTSVSEIPGVKNLKKVIDDFIEKFLRINVDA